MKSILGYDLIQKFEEFAPTYLAEEGDPVGLAIGTLNKSVKKILVTLDVRPEVVQEAISKNIDLIFAHHPPIFRPAKNLVTDDPQIKMYADLLKNDIAVYVAHTNLDVATNGMNAWLAKAIGITETEIMSVIKREKYKKLVVFVPLANKNKMIQALTQAGAGEIGPNYKDCTYTVEGTGSFTPVNQAQPHIGQLNEIAEVGEARIEVMFPERLTAEIEKALFSEHPYEEPVYDVYTIENYVDQYGLGRVGNLKEPVTIEEFAKKIKDTFNVAGLRYIAKDTSKKIQRVAICGGDAGKLYPDAIHKGAEVYITGDVYYHAGHDMLASNLNVIDPGHHIESICKKELATLFTNWSKEMDWDLEVMQSTLNTDPYRFI
ncbi:dinuclear metal center protein, YbgI/SA1388 family [Carnobacterium iners]|uniref:GTP cyclohydrolase 1 type 2 homolog n=1 Tax=Carnobacterium iners TaxID=1073423 RepID=A0A1X7NGK3_9LACT|nr:Nif3-like dinuclear metal center hexameric protein [Carnobacterium iners]SEK39608.1 dinuclear metal center protein, YbgI/SA1388 family [Carnobacterium iners]SMH36476.1 dinuclear metal center protein, YbgI/SA1388 family [Carnobacterium iners]